MSAYDVEVGGHRPVSREFFSGQPIFNIAGSRYIGVPGYSRSVAAYGAFYWKYGDNDRLNGNERLWDTAPLWGV
jgi:hypothetical protein